MRFQLTEDLILGAVTIGDRTLALELLPFAAALERIEAQYETEGGFIPDDIIPYYGAVWPAAKALVTELLAVLAGRQDLPEVLELGCGLGLPALIAAVSGCRVTAVDANPDALSLLARNAARNGVGLELFENDWLAVSGLLRPKSFDLILASDVLYEPYHVESLAMVAVRLLKPKGRVLLSDPCRWHYQEFIRVLTSKGFVTETRFEDVYDAEGRSRVMVASAYIDKA